MRLYYLVLVSLVVATGVASGRGYAADGVEPWTGGHTRLVWLQDQGDGTDSLAHGNNLSLYGYDSRDGKGERPLLPGPGSFFKPLFTPDGKAVIFSDRQSRRIYRFDWESGRKTDLGSGVAVAVWQDDEKKFLQRRATVWIYAFSGPQPENKYGTAQPLYRFPIDSPDDKELVWNKTNMAWSNLQLSRDGELIGGLFPWPHGGVLRTKDSSWQRLGRGCWTSLSPDNSYLLWIFDGLHRNVQMYNLKTGRNWKVNINNAPGIGGFEVYHPRWSNHPRYMTMTGPYEKGEGGNRIGGGGEKVEIYLGRLDATAGAVEEWLQVTHNSRADFYPDVWIAGGAEASLGDALVADKQVVKDDGEWPGDQEHLLFVWDTMQGENQVPESSSAGFYQGNLELHGDALHTRNFALATRGGWADGGEAGTRIARGLTTAQALSVEFTLTPLAAGDGDIMRLGRGERTALGISQNGSDLLITNNNGLQRRLGGILQIGVPQHLVLNFDGRQLTAWVNGQKKKTFAMPFRFSQLAADRLVLGDPQQPWRGVLSGISWHNSLLDERRIALGNERRIARQDGRADIDRLIVKGRLLETTEIPAPENIGAYSRALVVNVYEVDEVEEGFYSEKKVVVAEWAILDRRIIKEYPADPPVEELHLEKFDDHPELEGERQMMDVFEPDLDMYYRVPGV